MQVDLGNRPDLNAAAPGDFYELLGLEPNADQAAIRTAYRGLQRIVHPDIIGKMLGSPFNMASGHDKNVRQGSTALKPAAALSSQGLLTSGNASPAKSPHRDVQPCGSLTGLCFP